MTDSNRTRVVITAVGAVSGNAANKEELENSCAEGISGIRPCTVFDAEKLLTSQFGEVPGLQGPNRLFDLIEKSAAQMLEDAGLTREDISSYGTDCRMFYGTLLSTSDSYLAHSAAALAGTENLQLAFMNAFAAYVRALTGVRGMIDVSSAACASGTTALGMAFDFIRNGLCTTAIAGGADSLNALSAYGFHALKSLSGSVCNPYDSKHDGINIGECGAFFLVESLEHALARNARIYCEIIGYATGNDAYHATSPEPEGREAFHVMQEALLDAGIHAEDVDYINGHGTGTVLNDTMETKALHLLYPGENKPHVSSTKALIGHCMGASGAIELASVIQMMNSGRPIRMPLLTEPLDEELYAVPEKLSVSCAMSNSFGFAGNSAVLIIRKYGEGAVS